MTQFRSLPRPAQLYIVGIVLAGALVVVYGWAVHPVPPTPEKFGTLLYLGIGTQIAALRAIPWRRGHQMLHEPLLVATGLFAPGGGVGLVAWLATFDGRVPGRTTAWWGFLFNRAMTAIAHVVPSLAVASVGDENSWWTLPIRTVLYASASIGLNYILTGLVWAYVSRASVWTTLFENVGLSTLFATLGLSFSGGIIYLLLQQPVGFVMSPALFGFWRPVLCAIRG